MAHTLVENKCISFTLGTETYAHPVSSIKEILRYTAPNPIPGATYEVEGVLSVRGEAITVLSGRRLLKINDETANDSWCIVSLTTPSGLFGIVVDEVNEMIDLDQTQLETREQGNEFIKGTIRNSDQLVILVDFSTYCQKIAEYG
ncbi:chemotaxis signal transduction protein CheW [Oleiphilus messinensis]|uniref:Chemotaxis signal transduction protein CheW n=1 Tax=Oleiphilus messinensis TaxID=141451 RepID=A0A1Y0I541_9GAMM|nr:chemotaxis protein CheW [Oleiphilus messinensis]ARU55531.1 chemotaxis signal transduction protein CheW [Oleiphilus messinensis]